jgi:hypothetical protein
MCRIPRLASFWKERVVFGKSDAQEGRFTPEMIP